MVLARIFRTIEGGGGKDKYDEKRGNIHGHNLSATEKRKKKKGRIRGLGTRRSLEQGGTGKGDWRSGVGVNEKKPAFDHQIHQNERKGNAKKVIVPEWREEWKVVKRIGTKKNGNGQCGVTGWAE